MNPLGNAQAHDDAEEPTTNKARRPATPQTRGVAASAPSVPDYELLRRIGRGAYGDVWLARSQATGVLRAAKIVWRRSFDEERPFRREFEGIRRFEQISREHQSQLALFHIGRNDAEGYFYYVMELADPLRDPKSEPNTETQTSDFGFPSNLELGPSDLYAPHTLRADLQEGCLPPARVVEIGLALTEALAHLHQHGLVHRDVKPSNVIFVNGRPKLADIGLVTDASDRCSIVGTEGYLPPEGPGTPQADIFALGKVLYEAATGLDRREFPRLQEDLRESSARAALFECNEILLKACESDSLRRYQSAEGMCADLLLLRAGKSVRRKRILQGYWAAGKRAGFALGLVATLAVLVSVNPHLSTRPQPSTDGPDSTNLDANAYCDKGMYILRGDNYSAFPEAYTHFKTAIALDSNFARPYVGLLEMRVRESFPGIPESTPEGMRGIAQHLERLAPGLAATYVSKGVVNYCDCNFEEAERSLRAAIMANPNYELGQTFYGWLLLCYGRKAEACKQVEICRRLAPSKAVASYRSVANCYYLKRDYTNAITWYQTAVAWQAHEAASYSGLQACYTAIGDYTNAIKYGVKAYILSTGVDEARAGGEPLRAAFEQGGARGYWQQQWKWAENNSNNYYWRAEIQIKLGNTNEALAWLERARIANEHEGYLPVMSLLLFHQCWDGLHGDPRFQRLLNEVGLVKVMRPHID